MTSSSFPDVSVWLALLLEDHVHRTVAKRSWDTDQSDVIGFLRLTQMTWAAYDRLFSDDRVVFLDEPNGIEASFREYAKEDRASPKLWADAWLLAFAERAGGAVITFDRALAARAGHAVLLSG